MSIKLNGGLSVGEGSLHGLTHVKQASLGGSVGASATLAGAKWGRIKGDINDQTDLIEKFDRLHIDTTANWNAQADLIGKAGHIYVYSDYEVINGVAVPAFKVGDGLAYLIDTPFADGNMSTINDHIQNGEIHITEEERLFWNNKVTCFLSQGDDETVVFTKNKENG